MSFRLPIELSAWLHPDTHDAIRFRKLSTPSNTFFKLPNGDAMGGCVSSPSIVVVADRESSVLSSFHFTVTMHAYETTGDVLGRLVLNFLK
jgi:hypothetical protein